MSQWNTISLIGMPGAGKSTVGVILAKLTGLRFIDTDLDIQVREEATLHEIVQAHGYLRLREIEEEVLLDLPLDHALVSTGGSVVYSEAIMARLKAAGPLVYIEVDFPTLEKRVAATPHRGIASDSSQSFADVYAERTPLYERYADLRIDSRDMSADEVAARILEKLPVS
jgi:shikimate kinase